MEVAAEDWVNNDQVMFKLEGRNKYPMLNGGNGVVNTGLGQTKGLDIFNENIIKFEKVE